MTGHTTWSDVRGQRDTTFFGHGRLEVDEILQMLGRAGRGDRPGTAVALVRPTDQWKAGELADSIRAGTIAPIRSALDPQEFRASGRRGTRGRGGRRHRVPRSPGAGPHR